MTGRAFVAELAGLDLEGPMVSVKAFLPRHEFDAFARGVGTPYAPGDGDDRIRRCVALLACGTPRHPVREPDVLAIAACDTLASLLAAGEVRLTPALLEPLGRLITALGQPEASAVGRDLARAIRNTAREGGRPWPTTP